MTSHEYHYKHREVRIERSYPMELLPLFPSSPPPPPPPPPPPATSQRVYYVRTEVEQSPPPPKKRVVFIEVEKPPPPRVVFVRVEKSLPPKPLWEDLLGNDIMMKSEIPRDSSSTETKVIRLTSNQEAVLQAQFNRWPKNPHKGDVVLLAAETGLSEEDVQDWYSYKLAQLRKEQGLGGGFGIGNY